MKTKANDPVDWSQYLFFKPNHDGTSEMDVLPGLTKREYFAAMAMQGLIANSHDNEMVKPLSFATNIEIAELAVKQSDALIAELNKTNEIE